MQAVNYMRNNFHFEYFVCYAIMIATKERRSMKTDYSDIELLKNADWIGIDRRFCRSVVMFHYKFHCENTEITDAKMIIACSGSYRILINHRPVNGNTIEINFETSGVQAFKYDVADFLKSENALSVQVAGKMKLSETTAALDKYALIAVIAVTYADTGAGSTEEPPANLWTAQRRCRSLWQRALRI